MSLTGQTFKERLVGVVRRQRLVQLTRTAWIILRRDGISAFGRRLWRWLRGERRYFRGGLTPRVYRQYQQLCEPSAGELERQRLACHDWNSGPVFSIVTAVHNAPLAIFQAALESVRAQTYLHWAWHVVDASTTDEVWQWLSAQAQQDLRIRPVRLEHNEGISGNLNVALLAATGDYVVLLDHDDTLAPFALYEVARLLQAHPEADFVYSDADKLDESGQRCEPFFKPDWSPAMMLSLNLLNQLSVFRRSLLDRVGLFNPALDGAQDWDLYLRITEQTTSVFHIPKVLYHWRKTPQSTAQSSANKPYIREAQTAALQQHLARTGIRQPQVIFDAAHRIQRDHPLCRWQPERALSVAVVIPSRDQGEVVARCLESLLRLTAYPDFAVLLVDTGSVDPATHTVYDRFAAAARFRVAAYDQPFNFSAVCNWGAHQTQSDLILFLNNDTEVLHAEWLTRMVQWFERPRVAAVGPKLLYPSGRLQHAGVIVGLGGLASHLFLDEAEHIGTLCGSDDWYRDLLAVTGACLLVSRAAFEQIGGFDEAFRLHFSDVDLCLRLREADYRVVYTPDARLMHHESVSHGRRVPRADFERATRRWERWLAQGDPYFNPNLTYRSSFPKVRLSEEDSPAAINRELMQHLPDTDEIDLTRDLQ